PRHAAAQLVEPCAAEQELTHDEDRPPLVEDLHRLRQGTELAIGGRHGCALRPDHRAPSPPPAPPSGRAVQKQNWCRSRGPADSGGRKPATGGRPMGTTDIAAADDAAHQDVELKSKHRRMWGLGDYPRVAREIVSPLGEVLVDALHIGAEDRVLDVAAGTG